MDSLIKTMIEGGVTPSAVIALIFIVRSEFKKLTKSVDELTKKVGDVTVEVTKVTLSQEHMEREIDDLRIRVTTQEKRLFSSHVRA